jgi:hypothetical protein
MIRDCRGLPQDMSVCTRCPRLAEPTRTSDAPKVQWIMPDLRWEDGKWICMSRDVRPQK